MRLPEGTAWNGGRVVVVQGCGLARLLLAAAFISPSELGTFALAGAVLTAAASFLETGLRQQYVVNKRPREFGIRAWLWSVWITNLISKAVILVFAIAAGIIAALFYNDQLIFQIVAVSATTLVLSSLSNPMLFELERRRLFKAISLIEAAPQVLGLTVTLVLAICTNSVWSIVWGATAAAVSYTVISYLWLARPEWQRPSARIVRALILEGRHFSIVSAATFVTASLDKLVLGWFVSTASLGGYFIAQRIGEAPTRFASEVIARPMLVHYRGLIKHNQIEHCLKQERLQVLAFGAYSTIAAIAIVCAVLIARRLGFPPQGNEILWLLAIFLVAYGFRSACQIPAAVIVAAGKISTDAKFKIQESLVMLLLLVPCGMWYGATAVAILFALVYAWSFFRRQHFVSRSILAANP